MFVMLFGLMGVAAIMPVGNHYAARSERYDRGGALAASAFAELKSRGLLQPDFWLYPDSKGIMNNAGAFQLPFTGTNPVGAGHAFVIDPVGAAETTNTFFPYPNALDGAGNPWNGATPPLLGSAWPIRRVTMAAIPGGIKLTSRVAESIFRLRDDLSASLPDQNDRPGIQRWETVDRNPNTGANNNTPDYPGDDTPLARAYAGNYSWLATVVPVNEEALAGLQPADARHGSFLYEVSVAVFRKREDVPSIESERILPAVLEVGGNLELYSDTGNAGDDRDIVEAALQDIRNRDWIALAGVNPTTGAFVLRWYRLAALEDENNEDDHNHGGGGGDDIHRNAMLENVGLNDPLIPTSSNPTPVVRAILLPSVIGVVTQTVKLETN
jgi:hypothetical protein